MRADNRFDTPAPETFHSLNHNLPAQTTPFVGREAELTELARLIHDPAVRLITITAPGGMGKTRLALEAAEREISRFANGVCFVELASLNEVSSLVPAIAGAAGHQVQTDGREPEQQLLDFLQSMQLLLVLDNFEHLLAGTGLVSEILKAAPQVNILVTSRQRLNQPGETLFHLSGMDFPAWETPADALEYAAVKLFLQSAKRVHPGFEVTADNMDAIARICKLVQGMPLGIVLAGAWVAVLSPQDIASEIARSIDFLEAEGGEVPERQRSIRAVFDYAWQMISTDEQQVFRKLSVFRGGFTREAAEAVAGANLRILLSLVNKSLIHRNVTSGRYGIHEVMRQYSEEHLKTVPDVHHSTNELYMRYYVELINRYSKLFGTNQEKTALDALNDESANMDTVWQQMVVTRKIEDLKHCLNIYWHAYDTRGSFHEWLNLLTFAVDTLTPAAPHELLCLARLLVSRGWFLVSVGLPDQSTDLVEQGLALLRQRSDSDEILNALNTNAFTQIFRGMYLEAQETSQEALQIARAKGTSSEIAWALYWLGGAKVYGGDYSGAKPVAEECLALMHEAGDINGIHNVNGLLLGPVEMGLGNNEVAQTLCQTALQHYEATGYEWGMGTVSGTLAEIAWKQGHNATCMAYQQRRLQHFLKTRQTWEIIRALVDIARFRISRNRISEAVELLSLTEHASAAFQTVRQTATQLLTELEKKLTPERYAAAREHGKTLDLDTVVQQLLAEDWEG